MISRLKRLFGEKIVIKPIYNSTVYEDNQNSFCGGALADANILIVCDIQQLGERCEVIRELLKREKCNCQTLDIKSVSGVESIVRSCKMLLGPYDTVVNIITTKGNSYNMRDNFLLLQYETEYMVSSKSKGTICTVVLYDDVDISIEIRSELQGEISLIEGLGTVLPNHGIISNGVISASDVPFKKVMEVVVFLISKYGQVLDGQVIEMKA